MNIYLVTGASGMLGRFLGRFLLNRNAHVQVLVRPSSDVAFLTDEAVQIVAGEAGDSKAVRAAMSPAGLQLMSQDLHLAMSRTEEELGFRPRYSLVEGLAEMLGSVGSRQ